MVVSHRVSICDFKSLSSSMLIISGKALLNLQLRPMFYCLAVDKSVQRSIELWSVIIKSDFSCYC
jgi:hypothetical protein